MMWAAQNVTEQGATAVSGNLIRRRGSFHHAARRTTLFPEHKHQAHSQSVNILAHNAADAILNYFESV